MTLPSSVTETPETDSDRVSEARLRGAARDLLGALQKYGFPVSDAATRQLMDGGSLEAQAVHVAAKGLATALRTTPSLPPRSGAWPDHASPRPWTYHRKPSETTPGYRDWIEDANGNIVVEHVGHIDGPAICAAVNARSTLADPIPEAPADEDKARALALLAREDERQTKLHDLLETIREQIRVEVAPEHRPAGLMQNIQNAVYAMRGRTALMNDAAITNALRRSTETDKTSGATASRTPTEETVERAMKAFIKSLTSQVSEWTVDYDEGETLIIEPSGQEYFALNYPIRAAITAAPASRPSEAEPVAWRCFHCDEVFTDEHSARIHFGTDEAQKAACLIKGSEGGLVEALRRAEKDCADAWFAIHNETTDAAKAYHAQSARHQEQLRAVEQAGYDRGIADAKAHPETLGLYAIAPSTIAVGAAADWGSEDDYEGVLHALEIAGMGAPFTDIQGQLYCERRYSPDGYRDAEFRDHGLARAVRIICNSAKRIRSALVDGGAK